MEALEAPVSTQYRRSSNEGGDAIKLAGGVNKRNEIGTAISSFAGTRRPFEELLTAMRKGADLLKHGRQGKPKMHYFRLAENDTLLTWRSAKGTQRSVTLKAVHQVVHGQTTDAFKRYPNPNFVRLSFSLLYKDRVEGSGRTLDLTAHDDQTFELWFWGLQAVIDLLHPPQEKSVRKEGVALAMPQLSSPLAGAVGMPFGVQDASASLKSPAFVAPKPQPSGESVSKVSPPGLGGGTAQGRATGALGVPIPEHQLGDCYLWGTSKPSTSSLSSSRSRIQSLLPHTIKDTMHLDVMEVAVGLGHAGLITRGGEMYTWGDGTGGKLGLGHQEDADSPQRLHTLWGQPVRHVAVSDSCTAAITGDGQLMTWGEASTCSLGYDGVQRQYIPRPVSGVLAEHVIVQVSCGQFHSAALTSDGCLFTWGNGLLGKLGHGDCWSYLQPKQVECLKDKVVTQVACGAWHTAAIASPRPQGPGALEGLPFIERLAVQHKLAAVYELTEEDDGVLYTWGCAFKRTIDYREGSQLTKHTDHSGCLGLGDKSGRLLPTKVEGKMKGLAVTCVAVGLNFTVAVTSDGKVWQMGETGASGKGAAWEGALSPVQVGGPLTKHFVESVSAGAHHIAALAGPLNSSTGKAYEGLESTAVFMWGRGKEGQLGSGVATDSCIPQQVEELRGRRMVQVACGGNQSVAVCLHDPGADDTEERRKGYKAKMKQWFTGGRMTLEIPSRDFANSGPPSAASITSMKSQHHRDAAHLRPGSTTMENRQSAGLKKTLSGSGLVGGLQLDKKGKKVRRKGSTASEFGVPPSGLSTPTRPPPLHISTDVGGNSDANLTPREGGEGGRAPSEHASQHSSLNSTDQVALELAIGRARDGIRQAEDQENYVKRLEAKVEQLQSLLKTQSMQGGALLVSQLSATRGFAESVPQRPSIVDVSSPMGPNQDGRQMNTLPTHSSTGRRKMVPNFGLSSRRTMQSVLPNASSSTLLQNFAEASAAVAESHDLSKEAADLAKMRANLAAQLAQIDQRQAALAAAGIAPPGLASSPENGGYRDQAAQRMFGAGPPSSSKAARASSVFDTHRKEAGHQGRQRAGGGHRRSRSGSSSSVLRSPVSPFAVAQAEKSPGVTQQLAPTSAPWSEEVSPGVYLTLVRDVDGFNKLLSVRFSRHLFSRDAADQWWHANKYQVSQKLSLRGSEGNQTLSNQSSYTPATTYATPTAISNPMFNSTATSSAYDSGLMTTWASGLDDSTGSRSLHRRTGASGHRAAGESRNNTTFDKTSDLEGSFQERSASGHILQDWLQAGGLTMRSAISDEGFHTTRSKLESVSPVHSASRSIREHAISPEPSEAETVSDDSYRAGRNPSDRGPFPSPLKAPDLIALHGGCDGLHSNTAHSSLAAQTPVRGGRQDHNTGSMASPVTARIDSDEAKGERQEQPLLRVHSQNSSEENFGSARSSTVGEGGVSPQPQNQTPGKEPKATPTRGRLVHNTAKLVAAWESSGHSS